MKNGIVPALACAIGLSGCATTAPKNYTDMSTSEKAEHVTMLKGGKILYKCSNLTQETAQAVETMKDAFEACYGTESIVRKQISKEACLKLAPLERRQSLANSEINRDRDAGGPAIDYTQKWIDRGDVPNIDENGYEGYGDVQRIGAFVLSIIDRASRNGIDPNAGIVAYNTDQSKNPTRITTDTLNLTDSCFQHFGDE